MTGWMIITGATTGVMIAAAAVATWQAVSKAREVKAEEERCQRAEDARDSAMESRHKAERERQQEAAQKERNAIAVDWIRGEVEDTNRQMDELGEKRRMHAAMLELTKDVEQADKLRRAIKDETARLSSLRATRERYQRVLDQVEGKTHKTYSQPLPADCMKCPAMKLASMFVQQDEQKRAYASRVWQNTPPWGMLRPPLL